MAAPQPLASWPHVNTEPSAADTGYGSSTPPAVLLCSAGRRVELLEAFRQSAAALLGERARILASDLRPELSAACQRADQCFALPRVTAAGYPEALLELCLSQGVGLVVPTIDTELQVLADWRERFAAAGIGLVVSDPPLVTACRDKRRTAALMATIGLPTPAELDPQALRFPCFLKPVSGSCSQGVRAIASPEELSEAERLDPANLFQELIPPSWSEYSVDLYYNRQGRICGCVPRQRLEVRGGEISKGITRRDRVHAYLLQHLQRLDGARGVLTLQLFSNPDRTDFLGVEINPRFGGGYPMSHLAGVDYPGWLILEYILDQKVDYSDDWHADQLLLRHDSTLAVSR